MIIVLRKLLTEGLRDVLIPETLDVVFEENNGALVLIAGSLNIQDSLKDDFYGISMAAVKMRKVVQVGDSVCQLNRRYQLGSTHVCVILSMQF